MRDRRHAIAFVLGLMLPAVLTKPSSGWTSATTSATAAQSRFEIRGVTGHASHTHGGAPAYVGHTRFVFANHSDKSRRISVVDIEFLRAIKDCEHPPKEVVSHPKSGGILLEDEKQRESAPHVEVKAGLTVDATVSFVAVSAYSVYCDRFAFRVTFLVDGEKVSVIDEVNIIRRQPLHPGDQ